MREREKEREREGEKKKKKREKRKRKEKKVQQVLIYRWLLMNLNVLNVLKEYVLIINNKQDLLMNP